MKSRFSRRELFRAGLLGGGAALSLDYLGISSLGTWASQSILNPLANSLDSYHLFADAVRGGASFLSVHQAIAATASPWAVVTIKIVNNVATPLMFRLGDLSVAPPPEIQMSKCAGTHLGDGAFNPLVMTVTGAHIETKGVEKISDIPRYANLRMNKFFADMLHHGTNDGLAGAGANQLGVPAAAIGEFPSQDHVAIQCGLHLGKSAGQNHSLTGFKLSPTLPDLSKFVLDQNIIKSPLGITCFMMGDYYDKAEGTNAKNMVCDESLKDTGVILGRSVKEYYQAVSQSIALSYSDKSTFDKNLTAKFDKLVSKDAKLRKALLDSHASFQSKIASLGEASILEQKARQPYVEAHANGQADPTGAANYGAGTEFLGQCLYVAKALELDGTPKRNFSLFLNQNDLDGRGLSNLKLDIQQVGVEAGIRSLSYQEGTRQLAMGLNILAQSIKSGKKLIVVVVSEGGRLKNMGDGDLGFGMILGPKSSGLVDHLYCNRANIGNSSSPVVTDPGFLPRGGGAENAFMWDNPVSEPFGLVNPDGTRAQNMISTMGHWQMGVANFLARQAIEAKEKDSFAPPTPYVRFKTS